MTFNLFGYTILIAKRKSNKGGSTRFVKDGVIITSNNCYLMIADKNGVIIPKQRDLYIQSPLEGPMIATVSFLVGGVMSENEALDININGDFKLKGEDILSNPKQT